MAKQGRDPKDMPKALVALRGFDAAHYRRTERYAKQVQKLFDTATQELCGLATRWQEDISTDPDEPFAFDAFPRTKRQAQGFITRLVSKVTSTIEQATRQEWMAACSKNDAFLGNILRTSKLTHDEVAQYQDRNIEALSSFQKRKSEGMNLSDRVWRIAGNFKNEMETAIDVAIGDGRPAAELSRDVRGLLNQPDKLFRRVRDKATGQLRLSKAAAAYHPGQGVYRSSYLNAMRLARTEVNMAYRQAEYLRWQQLDFVVGFRIWLSNNHTRLNSKGKPEPFEDICDKLAGDYPKTFKFLGWHPQCRCVVTPIMKSYKEYNDERAGRLKAIVRGETYKSLPSRRTVPEVPPQFRAYIDSIAQRSKGWKSQPYYIRDNFKGGTIEGGLKLAGGVPSEKGMPTENTLATANRKNDESKGTVTPQESTKVAVDPISQTPHALTPLTKEQRAYTKSLTKEIIGLHSGKTVHNVVDIKITSHGIREYVNQPHHKYLAKNEEAKHLPELLKGARFIGEFPPHNPKGNPNLSSTLVYEAYVLGERQYLIVHKFKNGDVNFYGISVNPPKQKP